jgi:hypothetical protein
MLVETVRVDRFGSAATFLDYFKARYVRPLPRTTKSRTTPSGLAPWIVTLVALAQHHVVGAEQTLMHWEYLLLTARKRT